MLEIARKEMKRGREAPAVRVKKIDGKEDVIGMLAPEMQLLVSLNTLNTSESVEVYKKIKEISSLFKKLKTVFVISKNGAICKCLEHEDEVGKFQVVYDSSYQFGNKYGTQIISGNLKESLTTSATIIEFEGRIHYREVLENLDEKLNFQEIKKSIQNVFDEKKKQKGHSHEEWMRY